MIDRPLDFLNQLKGQLVEIQLKHDTIEAELVTFDIHINLVVISEGKKLFLRGDSVISIRGVDDE